MALWREARPAKPAATQLLSGLSRPVPLIGGLVVAVTLLDPRTGKRVTFSLGEERSTARAPTAYKKPATERARREVLRALDRSLSARDH